MKRSISTIQTVLIAQLNKKKKKKGTGNKVRNVEVNVGIMTSQSGCKVMPCDLLHASTENIVTGR